MISFPFLFLKSACQDLGVLCSIINILVQVLEMPIKT